MNSPLESVTAFHVGPIPVTTAVIITWALMAALALTAFLLTRRLTITPTARQTVIELLVEAIDSQIHDIAGSSPAPYRGFVGTLFVFILAANWSSLLPGVEPPTANLETDAALALLVFLSVIWFGVRRAGLAGYLKSFATPNPFMIPLNLMESVTRTFSMFVRLFGNVMSGVFVIGIVASLAGLLVPIPLMALDMVTGLIQAYIFAVLAMVFIAATDSGSAASPPGATSPRPSSKG